MKKFYAVALYSLVLVLLASSLQAGKELLDKRVGGVNGVIITLKQLQTPQITNNAKPFTFEQYVAHLLWLEKARAQNLEPAAEEVARSVLRYKEENGFLNMSDEEADRVLENHIGLTFKTYEKQLTEHYMIESLKSYEFRNRCSVAEAEVTAYCKEHPVVEEATYQIEIAILKPEQEKAWRDEELALENLEWDAFAPLKESLLAPHLRAVTAVAEGECCLAYDPASQETLLVRVVAKSPAHVKTVAERYPAVESLLQRKKVEKYAQEAEKEALTDAVIVRLE